LNCWFLWRPCWKASSDMFRTLQSTIHKLTIAVSCCAHFYFKLILYSYIFFAYRYDVLICLLLISIELRYFSNVYQNWNVHCTHSLITLCFVLSLHYKPTGASEGYSVNFRKRSKMTDCAQAHASKRHHQLNASFFVNQLIELAVLIFRGYKLQSDVTIIYIFFN
jgi:hypothetical protein